MYWIQNETEINYWLGGLITAGIAPQFTEDAGFVYTWDAAVRRWLNVRVRFQAVNYCLSRSMYDGGAHILPHGRLHSQKHPAFRVVIHH